MRRALAAVAIMLAVAVANPAAASGLEKCPVQGGTIRAAMAGSPPTLDWVTSFAAQTRDMGVYLYESLVTIDENYDPAPQLASSWTASRDGLVYTFALRRGVKFHDGSPLTAADVKASFDRFLEVSPRKADLKMVKATRVVDDHTFEVTLSEPSAAFVALLAYPGPAVAVMPRKVIAGLGAGKLPLSGVIGTGPYRLVEWIPDRHVHLRRFADYAPGPGEASGYAGRRLACVEDIYFVPVPEVSSRVAGLESGSYDYVQNLQAEAYKRLSAAPGIQTVIIKPYYLVAMHLNTAHGPFKDRRLRRAVQVGLNQEEVMLTAAGDPALFRLDPSIFFKEQFWHSTIGANRYNERNAAEARRLIKEAGYDGAPVRINTASNFQWMYLAAVATESQLRQLGFNTRLQAYDYPTMMDIFRKKRDAWDISYNGFSIRTDPGGFTFVFHSSSGYQPYASQEVDSLLERALGERDRKKRAQLYEQFQDVVYRDVPVIKHGDLFGFDALRDRVRGFSAYYTTPRFWNTWVQDGK